MRIEDVVHYVPIVGSSISSDGRFVVTATPIYSEEKALRPVLSRVLDLDSEKKKWEFLNAGDGVESFYNPSIAPDSVRFAAFRYSNALLDIAVGQLDQPLNEPTPLTGIPIKPSAIKWRGLPGEVCCLGSDDEGTRRIWVWEENTGNPVAITPAQHSVFDYAFSATHKRLAWIEQKRQDQPTPWLHISDELGQQGFSMALSGSPVGFLSWSPDGKKVAFMGRPEGHRLARSEVFVITLNDGQQDASVECITENLEGWITSYDWNTKSSALVLAVDQGTYGRLARVSLGSLEVEFLGQQDGYLSGPSLDRNRGQMLFLRQNGAIPQQLCIQKGRKGKPKVLTRFNRKFEQRKRFDSESIHWTAADGTPLDGIFMRPEGEGPFPTLMWIHGGPAEHINRTFSPYFQSFVSKGWAVFAPNYRGSTGRSSAFLRANVGDLCGEDVNDILSGLESLISQGEVNTEQIACMGWSYGGSLGLMACARSNHIKALVTVAPVVDWISVFGAQTFPAITRQYFEEDIWENRDIYDKRSPVSYADLISVPTLFLHGALDPLVPPSQSALMERLLKGQGVETEFHLYPGEFHVFMMPQSITRMLNMVMDWIEKARS